jgi:hypothetical protein
MAASGSSRDSSATSLRRRRSTAAEEASISIRPSGGQVFTAVNDSRGDHDFSGDKKENRTWQRKRSVICRAPEGQRDGTATETIKPGYLVKGVLGRQADGDGQGPEVRSRSSATNSARASTTRTRATGTISAFYASGDKVKVGVFKSGDEVLGYVASGQNIAEDDLLESNGDGTFKEGSANPIARALETLGARHGGPRRRVQIL